MQCRASAESLDTVETKSKSPGPGTLSFQANTTAPGNQKEHTAKEETQAKTEALWDGYVLMHEATDPR